MKHRNSNARSAEDVILAHLPDIVTLCNRMLRQPSDAQDAAHQAVVAILRALPTYRGDGPIRHWVLKVALNAARQHRRSLSRMSQREGARLPEAAALREKGPSTVPTNPAEEREQQETLRAAIAALPDDLREPLILHYHHGLTQTEVAETLGCSQKTVSVRLSKGRERLQRELTGNAALGIVLAGAAAGVPVLDTVAPAFVATVKQTIAGHLAATAAAGSAATGTATTTANVLTNTLATGGNLMQAKVIAGAAALSLAGLVGGFVLSSQVIGASREAEHRAELAAADDRDATRQAEINRLRAEMDVARARQAARVASLAEDATALRDRLAARDAELAELRDQAAAAAEDAGAAQPAGREERWAELRATMGPVLAILQQMQEEGANQFALGPQLVGELGKFTPEDFAAIVAFDAQETDPGAISEIRAVMLQALTFVPGAAEHRDEFMGRYIERARSGTFGADFTAGALRQISFSMPPFVDAYAKIVQPLDEGLRTQLLDMALDRAASGASESLRMDGVSFLRRVDEPRATEALIEIVRQPANSARLRLKALDGLSRRADQDSIEALRDVAAADQDERVRAAAAKLLARATDGR